MNAPVEPARMQRSLSFLTDSIRERAQRLAAERQHAAAAIEYQVLIDIDPSDVQSGLRLAHQLVEAGQHARASDEYLRLSGVYARLGHERRAMTVALQALRLEPSRAVRQRLASDRLVLAFVAEFSRGKSELINALFFADTGANAIYRQSLLTGQRTGIVARLGIGQNGRNHRLHIATHAADLENKVFGIEAGIDCAHASLPGRPQLPAEPLLNSSQCMRKPFGPLPQTTNSRFRESR